MSFDMRSLYYIKLFFPKDEPGADLNDDALHSNENCLNQNFTILTQTIAQLESRLAALEND